MLGWCNLFAGVSAVVPILTADTDSKSTLNFGRFGKLQQAKTTAPRRTAAEDSIDAVTPVYICNTSLLCYHMYSQMACVVHMVDSMHMATGLAQRS